jgi:cytochrome b561
MVVVQARSEQAYTPTAKTLHWVTAVLVLFMLPAGILMANMPDSETKNLLFHLHRSTGVVLIPIILLRVFYRLTHPPAPLPPDLPPLMRFAAEANHLGLYAFLIVQPFIGWIATSAYRAPILVFWLFELPPIWPEDRVFSERMFTVHRLIGIGIALLVIAHIGGALFHHFIRRDTVLLRMLRGTG